MQNLFRKLIQDRCSKLDTVLHVGAGRCQEIRYFVQLSAKKILLVEANPRLADQLRVVVRGIEQAEVFNIAVAEKDGNFELKILTNDRESSLYCPDRLFTYFPNLEISETLPVKATTLSEFVRQHLTQAPPYNNLLILEVQGAESSIISSTPINVLQKFRWIAVRTSEESLYQAGSCLNDINAVLRNCGFEQVVSSAEKQSTLIRDVFFRRDPKQIENLALRERLDNGDQALRALQERVEEQEKDLRGLLARIDGYNTRLKEQRLDIGNLTKERDRQVEQTARLKIENDELLQRMTALDADLTTLRIAHHQQRQLAEQRRTELERLSKEPSDQTERASTLQAEKLELSQRVAALRGELDSLRATRDGHRQLIEQYRTELERLTNDRNDQVERAAVLQVQNGELSQRIKIFDGELATLRAERDQQTRSEEEHRIELERQTKERKTIAERAARMQADNDDLSQRVTTLDGELSELRTAHDQQVRLAEERRAESEVLAKRCDEHAKTIVQLENERDEQDNRQVLLREEIKKAEAQIELIKDVLLSEKTL